MSTERATDRRRTQIFQGLTKNTTKAKMFFRDKANATNYSSKELDREREDILRGTFYELTKWKSSASGARTNTAYNSPRRSYKNSLPYTESLSIQSDLQKEKDRTIIHDTFSNFMNRKHKMFNIGFNTFVIKKKGRFDKNGLGQLASNLASSKPLKAKENVQSKKIQEKRLKFRNSKRLIALEPGQQLSQNAQEQKFEPKGGSFCKQQLSVQPKIFRNKSQRPKRHEIFHPWQENQENLARQIWCPVKGNYCLSDIIQ